MTLQWLISTCGERVQLLEHLLMAPMPDVSYVVSVQNLNHAFPTIPEFCKRPDVSIHFLEGDGLSRNRNHALQHSNADIVVIADDDIALQPSYVQNIIRSFELNPKVDIGCFQIQTTDTGKPYKSYPAAAKKLTTMAALKQVSSIEIAFRRAAVTDADIRFDERFGLGRTANSGEELLFLHDCVHNGLNIHFFPQYIVEHPSKSSVNQTSAFDPKRLFVSGAQNYVLYGKGAYFRHFLAAIKRFSALKKNGLTFTQFMKYKNEGCAYIRLHR